MSLFEYLKLLYLESYHTNRCGLWDFYHKHIILKEQFDILGNALISFLIFNANIDTTLICDGGIDFLV